MAGKGYERQQGAALVLVLWLVTLLSIMAAAISPWPWPKAVMVKNGSKN